MTAPDDPVLRFLAGEFASLRAQMATMTRQERLMLASSLLAPALLLLYGLFLLVVPEATSSKPEERLYVSPADPKRLLPLPPALDPAKGPAPAPAVALSIVVPAYNEKLRLPQMLKDVHEFLSAPSRTRAEAFGAGVSVDVEGWEVILVDDGSEDGTDLIALSVGHEWEKLGWTEVGQGIGRGELRVVKLEANRGKGGAVKHVRRWPSGPCAAQTSWLTLFVSFLRASCTRAAHASCLPTQMARRLSRPSRPFKPRWTPSRSRTRPPFQPACRPRPTRAYRPGHQQSRPFPLRTSGTVTTRRLDELPTTRPLAGTRRSSRSAS